MVARAGWLFVPTEGHLLAVNGRSGELVWRRDFDSRMGVPPVVDGDRMTLGFDDGRVVLVDVTTGATLWVQLLGGAVSGLQMDAERVYAGSRDRFLYCLQTANGRMAWRWRTGGDVVGAALLDEQHVYFVSLDNLIRALDRRHGAQRWHKPIKSRPLGGPVIAGDAVIAAGLTPEIHGFSRRDGAPLGPLRTAAEIAAPPYVHPRPLGRGGDLLIVLLADGRLVAARRRIEPPIVPLVTVPGVPVSLTPPPGWSPPAS
jgi:outer membrane protein assembly factor BamB